jgi:hypothetical protein
MALSTLTAAGLTVKATGDGGLMVTPIDCLNDDLRAFIRDHKATILAELAANDGPAMPASAPGCVSDFDSARETGKRWALHVMHCKRCYPANSTYCEEGRRLKTIHERSWEA